MITTARTKLAIGTVLLAATASGCKTTGASEAKMAQLTPAQSLADFQSLAATFQSLYGPLTFKEQKFGFNYNDLVAKTTAAINASTGDTDTYAAITAFLATFHDGHVHISFPGNAVGISAYSLSFNITPLENRAIVSAVDSTDPTLTNVKFGDELLTIDGKKPIQDLLRFVLKYDVDATDDSNQHQISDLLYRPFYMKELIPKSSTATLVFARPDGSQYTVTSPWQKQAVFDEAEANLPQKNARVNALARHQYRVLNRPYATIEQMGQAQPIFATPQVLAAYGFTPVVVTPTYLAKYRLTDAPAIAAYTYSYGGRTILLIRQPAYDTDTVPATTLLGGYKAIMDQMQNNVDVLIVDQTHNPGGDVDYATGFFQLFVNGVANNEVEHLHIDRKWEYDIETAINGLVSQPAATPAAPTAAPTAGGSGGVAPAPLVDNSPAAQLALLKTQYEVIDAMSNANSTLLTPTPYPLSGVNQLTGDAQFTWKKPVLVLTDELAGSCGDLFPMLMQRNKIAKTFGHATMGLGGNVDDNAITLPFTQARVDVTRGLYTTYRPDGSYSNADLVENVGIPADVPFSHTVADFRAGYVAYVKAFSDTATAQIPAGTPVATPPPPAQQAPADAPPGAPVSVPSVAPTAPAN